MSQEASRSEKEILEEIASINSCSVHTGEDREKVMKDRALQREALFKELKNLRGY